MPEYTESRAAITLVVADSSPLIALGILDILNVLPLIADAIWIPETVRNECLAKQGAPGTDAILRAISSNILLVKPDIPDDDQLINLLSLCLDRGEAQAIALAKRSNALLLIDEKMGRTTAEQMGLSITGSLAMLIKAKKAGLLNSIKPAIQQLQASGYRYSGRLVEKVLLLAGE